jgi:elongator complex protein 2
MMLWGYDTPNELWLSDAAVGDAGASCLGFYGGAFNPSGDQLVAHGFTGALHLWRQQAAAGSSGSSGSSGRRLWVPQHALGGHYGAVQDLSWGADGACLQTVATDQTARLFTGIKGHWFELARTQVGLFWCLHVCMHAVPVRIWEGRGSIVASSAQCVANGS